MNTHYRKWRDVGYWDASAQHKRDVPSSVPARYKASYLRGYDARISWEKSRAQKTTRLVFLDIDGCMNSVASMDEVERIREKCPNFPESREWYQQFPERVSYHATSIWRWFPQWSIEALNAITGRTGAQIVISSTWKDDAITPLRRYGAHANIIGVTPYLRKDGNICRGDEIELWLHRFAHTRDVPRVTSFVILDDDADMGHLMHRLVQTDVHGRGLTGEHVERAIEILNTPLS